jgi:polo-like kinase 1
MERGLTDYITKEGSLGKYSVYKGGFAKCYQFTVLDSKKIVAAKIISKDSISHKRAKQKLMQEIRIHRSLHPKNVVNFENYFEDADNIYILLEMCRNHTLNELLKRRKKLQEIEVKYYIKQILEGVKYLHEHKIIHREYLYQTA